MAYFLALRNPLKNEHYFIERNLDHSQTKNWSVKKVKEVKELKNSEYSRTKAQKRQAKILGSFPL